MVSLPEPMTWIWWAQRLSTTLGRPSARSCPIPLVVRLPIGLAFVASGRPWSRHWEPASQRRGSIGARSSSSSPPSGCLTKSESAREIAGCQLDCRVAHHAPQRRFARPGRYVPRPIAGPASRERDAANGRSSARSERARETLVAGSAPGERPHLLTHGERREEADREHDRVDGVDGQPGDDRQRGCPPLAALQEERDRQQEDHRVVRPDDRRDQDGRDGRHRRSRPTAGSGARRAARPRRPRLRSPTGRRWRPAAEPRRGRRSPRCSGPAGRSARCSRRAR